MMTEKFNSSEPQEDRIVALEREVGEMGDFELAERIARYPEAVELFAQGGAPDPEALESVVTMFAGSNPDYIKILLEHASASGLLPYAISDTVKIVGGKYPDDEHRARVTLGHTAHIASAPQRGERELSMEEGELFALADNIAREERIRHVGGFRDEDFAQSFHAFKGKIPGSTSPANYLSMKRAGNLASLEDDTPLYKFHRVLHEQNHMKSFASYQIHTNHTLLPRRLGLASWVYKENEKGEIVPVSYMKNIDEAVCEEVTRRQILALPVDHPVVGSLLAKRLKELEQVYAGNVFSGDKKLEGDEAIGIWGDGKWCYTFAYPEERKVLFQLFDRIISSLPEEFSSVSLNEGREQLFEMLKKARYTGNILPFGRLMNRAFGLGKFREFGHLQTAEEQKAFIDAL